MHNDLELDSSPLFCSGFSKSPQDSPGFFSTEIVMQYRPNCCRQSIITLTIT